MTSSSSVNKLVFFLLLSSIFNSHSFAADYEIKGSSIFFKDVSFQILTPTMFRIQQGANSVPPSPDLGVVNVTFPATPFKVEQSNQSYSIQTDSLDILYDPAKEITEGGIEVKLRHDSNYLFKKLADKDTLNLGGVISSLDNFNGDKRFSKQNDVSSKSEPRVIPDGILSRRGFTVLKHTKDKLYMYKPGDEYLDLYVLGYGDNFKQALNNFYQVAGSIPMLPKWVLGFIYSRWADYTDNDIKKIVSKFRQEEMPIDAVILDMSWHKDDWFGFQVDTHNFPDLKAFNSWADSVHVKTGFNHHSGAIYGKDSRIPQFCEMAGLDPEKALITDSLDPKNKVIHYDTTNKKQFTAFYDLFISPLVNDGFKFLWVDGERSIYSSEWYQDYLSKVTEERPVVLNRLHNNVLSNHRYSVGFSGDTYISWETMSFSLQASIKGGNGGVNWSHDIGGYMPQGPAGYPPSGELFARWLQLGAVSPIFRAHAKKADYWTPKRKPGDFDQGSRLPWEWGETVLNSAKVSIQLRNKLSPYTYTMARLAHDTGMPLVSGLYLTYPKDDKAYRYDEYLFGDNFLVAPIMNASAEGEKGATKRTLWLPEGDDWYDYFTNQFYKGNQDVSVTKTLAEFPLFVKAGSIIPMSAYQDNSVAPLDTLLINVYAAAQNQKSTFKLYEDDGSSFLFEKGQYTWTDLDYTYTPDISQEIVIHSAKGTFQGSINQRSYRISVVNTNQPKMVYLNKEEITDWSWAPSTRELVINISKKDVGTDLVIEAKL